MPLKQLSDSEAAYLAGVIDGEGTITLTRMHRGQNRRAVVSVANTELALLLYVRSVVGAGRVTGKIRSRLHHSRSFAYAICGRQALTLLARVSPYLRTYKASRARLLLSDYVRLTPRNGRYTPQLRAQRQAFEARFFAYSLHSKVPDSPVLPTLESGERPVQIRPPVAEHEPVVAQLRDGLEIEAMNEHGIALLGGLGDLGPHRVGDER